MLSEAAWLFLLPKSDHASEQAPQLCAASMSKCQHEAKGSREEAEGESLLKMLNRHGEVL